MDTPAKAESYFEFTANWLAKQPERTRKAQRVARLKPVRRVSELLAAQTRNRIRSGKPDWQRLRWRVRHKVTDAVRRVAPEAHDKGIHGLVAEKYPNHRLTLAHTPGDRLRLKATLEFLNTRVDHQLSPRCYGNRPNATRNCSDRRTAVRRFQRLVWTDGNRWVAKLDVRKFYDNLPHDRVIEALKAAVRDRGCVRETEGYMAWYWGQCWPGHPTPPKNPVGLPQGSPVSAVLANIYMTEFDNALSDAGIEHIRFLDDVTIVARSAEQLADHLELAMQLIEGLDLGVAAEKTRIAYLGTERAGSGSPPTTITLPKRGDRLQVHREFDELGVYFYADGQFRARHRTVNRLLSKARREIRRDRGKESPVKRYLRTTAALNFMLGYKVSVRRPGSKPLAHGGKILRLIASLGEPSRRVRVRTSPQASGTTFIYRRTTPIIGNCWINGLRYVQPRQHALLGHSDLIFAQMQRVDRVIRRWMRREFERPLALSGLAPALMAALKGRRVRSAAKMFEMAAREPGPPCSPGES